MKLVAKAKRRLRIWQAACAIVAAYCFAYNHPILCVMWCISSFILIYCEITLDNLVASRRQLARIKITKRRHTPVVLDETLDYQFTRDHCYYRILNRANGTVVYRILHDAKIRSHSFGLAERVFNQLK